MTKRKAITLVAVLLAVAVAIAGVLVVRGQGSKEVPFQTVLLEDTEFDQVPQSSTTLDKLLSESTVATASRDGTSLDEAETIVAEPGPSAAVESTGRSTANSQSESPLESPPLQSSRAVEIDRSQFRQLLNRDDIAPIYEPQFSLAQDASLDPEELVIGVEINGESKAYPIGPLARREMVNDVVGGVPILVTW